jgi:hypothetical protein
MYPMARLIGREELWCLDCAASEGTFSLFLAYF